jgi:2-polyprenyl-3-methyl-5-hydroxy-6-metoxy-1,4-benzoquinol methylase
MNEEIDMLENISEFYKNGDIMDELLVDREINLIKKLTGNPGRAIEIGCGNGYSTERLFKLFDDLVILEPSKKNLELMKNRLNSEINTYNGLLEDYQTDKKFDHVFFLNVLEHVADPFAALKKIETLLSDEGQVFISVPNCMSLNRRAGFEMGLLESYETFAPKDYLVGHRRLYTVEMLTEHIEKANLKLETMKGIYLKPLAESQMMELGLDTVKAFYSLGEDVPHYCANLFAVAKKRG